ncbi:SRA stem-loop-interacting RNA-binding protein, mitochondrial-like [Physella acuta]|uniref:SRA stem-loop-interacting RNA-binding protein, mitochondrial-like n=1 Tax=Physella acuta TaxID=109671 RepID=UPI0027DC71AF|nr:SRA stem-loop-interacting RNA-binding protein, mitochondrial-like [Physella acuta]
MSRCVLFVRNIGWACARSDLQEYFKNFGKVLKVTIPMNWETGFNKNVAFISMNANLQSIDKLVKDYHVIDGQEVTVEIRSEGRKPEEAQ